MGYNIKVDDIFKVNTMEQFKNKSNIINWKKEWMGAGWYLRLQGDFYRISQKVAEKFHEEGEGNG